MKTAGRENQTSRVHSAEGQNRSCSNKWAAKQEKIQPLEWCFFLTSPFIEHTRSWARLGEGSRIRSGVKVVDFVYILGIFQPRRTVGHSLLARFLQLIGIFVVALCFACGTALSNGPNNTLLIEHVTLIDSTGAEAKDNVSVLIEGERIKSIVVSEENVVAPVAIRVNGKGKFLIAGLWDMHVHTLSKNQPDSFFPLFLASGVTGVRDMGGDLSLPQIQQLKRELVDGSRLGPEIFAAGPILEGEHPFWPFSIAGKNESDARPP